MYLRVTWSLIVAIGLMSALAIVIALRVASGNYGSTMITNILVVASAVALLWWRIDANSANAATRRSHKEGAAETTVRQIRSQ